MNTLIILLVTLFIGFIFLTQVQKNKNYLSRLITKKLSTSEEITEGFTYLSDEDVPSFRRHEKIGRGYYCDPSLDDTHIIKPSNADILQQLSESDFGKRSKEKASGMQNINQAINHYKTELIKEPNYQIKIPRNITSDNFCKRNVTIGELGKYSTVIVPNKSKLDSHGKFSINSDSLKVHLSYSNSYITLSGKKLKSGQSFQLMEDNCKKKCDTSKNCTGYVVGKGSQLGNCWLVGESNLEGDMDDSSEHNSYKKYSDFEYSISFWIKTDFNNNSSSIFEIVGSEGSNEGSVIAYVNNKSIVFVTSSEQLNITSPQMKSNMWVHIAICIKGKNITYYINGDKVGHANLKNTPRLPKNGTLNCPAKKGQSLEPVIEINEFVWYPLALPDNYIKSLFQSSKSDILCDKTSLFTKVSSPTDAYSKAYIGGRQELSKEDCEKSCANNNECNMYAHNGIECLLYPDTKGVKLHEGFQGAPMASPNFTFNVKSVEETGKYCNQNDWKEERNSGIVGKPIRDMYGTSLQECKTMCLQTPGCNSITMASSDNTTKSKDWCQLSKGNAHPQVGGYDSWTTNKTNAGDYVEINYSVGRLPREWSMLGKIPSQLPKPKTILALLIPGKRTVISLGNTSVSCGFNNNIDCNVVGLVEMNDTRDVKATILFQKCNCQDYSSKKIEGSWVGKSGVSTANYQDSLDNKITYSISVNKTDNEGVLAHSVSEKDATYCSKQDWLISQKDLIKIGNKNMEGNCMEEKHAICSKKHPMEASWYRPDVGCIKTKYNYCSLPNEKLCKEPLYQMACGDLCNMTYQDRFNVLTQDPLVARNLK